MASRPGDARGALCLSFDNLGEAAAIELGAIAADDPSVGEHPTVTRTLPSLLRMLGEREPAATFFVEGLNAELYPEALKSIAAGGHEVAYHAWRHEQWGDLTAVEQKENLARGQAAFAELGLEIRGLRPPGGRLGPGGIEVLRPAAFLADLEAEIAGLREDGLLSIVLHLSLLDWLGPERLGTLLGSLRRAADGNRLWVAPCRSVAAHLLAHADRFPRRPALDSTTWSETSS